MLLTTNLILELMIGQNEDKANCLFDSIPKKIQKSKPLLRQIV